eukprot:TRINITY_DN12522_c0_g1_i6.p6 TRINITY_DN12522_c0_g1~~TRINITY_DN12522_c0_g1_i6.p6  ORF type:complete len:136 (+),score=13.76 TRINITY_DN12522_c0_g1_i6:355-762(+)
MLEWKRVKLCLVRKLAKPLTKDERDAVLRFAKEAEGKKFSGRAKLMMENHSSESCCNCCGGHPYERFQCSGLVAAMLEAIGRVEKKEDLQIYIPKGDDMEIIQQPHQIVLTPNIEPNSLPPKTDQQLSRFQDSQR